MNNSCTLKQAVRLQEAGFPQGNTLKCHITTECGKQFFVERRDRYFIDLREVGEPQVFLLREVVDRTDMPSIGELLEEMKHDNFSIVWEPNMLEYGDGWWHIKNRTTHNSISRNTDLMECLVSAYCQKKGAE